METLYPVVLITEITRGAGYEISKLFARAKYRMIIASNECATLHNISEILKMLGAPTVSTICVDLSHESAAEEIIEQVLKKEGTITTLINSIGGHHHQVFSENHINRQSRIIHQDVLSVVKLTSLVLDQMRLEGKGQIFQVLSDESDHLQEPTEKGAQSFITSFMEAVANEPRNAGIDLITHRLGGSTLAGTADPSALALEFCQHYFDFSKPRQAIKPKYRDEKKAAVS